MKLKRYERVGFDSFSKRGSALYEADRRGGASDILSPKMMSSTTYVRIQLLGPLALYHQHQMSSANHNKAFVQYIPLNNLMGKDLRPPTIQRHEI